MLNRSRCTRCSCKSAIKEWSLKALMRKQELLEAFGLVFVSVDAFHASRTRVDTPESLTTHFFCWTTNVADFLTPFSAPLLPLSDSVITLLSRHCDATKRASDSNQHKTSCVNAVTRNCSLFTSIHPIGGWTSKDATTWNSFTVRNIEFRPIFRPMSLTSYSGIHVHTCTRTYIYVKEKMDKTEKRNNERHLDATDFQKRSSNLSHLK